MLALYYINGCVHVHILARCAKDIKVDAYFDLYTSQLIYIVPCACFLYMRVCVCARRWASMSTCSQEFRILSTIQLLFDVWAGLIILTGASFIISWITNRFDLFMTSVLQPIHLFYAFYSTEFTTSFFAGYFYISLEFLRANNQLIEWMI